MASSSKRFARSELGKQRSKSFKTVIYPQQEKIEICPTFKAGWHNELNSDPCGYLVHPTGNSVYLELHLHQGNCYMTSGKLASVLFGIKEPTEVMLNYKINHNCFTLNIIKQGVLDISSDYDESTDQSVIPFHDHAYTLHDYDNDRLFGWEVKVSKACACNKKDQVLHIPPRTAESVIRDMKTITIRTQHNLDGTKCNIKTYTRENERKDKFFTEGWYEFKKANHLREGDKLQFQLSDPPDVVVIEIVRCNR